MTSTTLQAAPNQPQSTIATRCDHVDAPPP